MIKTIDIQSGETAGLYQHLSAAVTPRPIAFVSTVDSEGNETTLEFTKLMTIIKSAGYTGFVGVEYEGSRLSEKDGIIATKKLLETIGAKL